MALSRFRSAVAALLAGALILGIPMLPAQAAVADPAPAAPAAPAATTASPISEVALQPYLPGEQSWPSSFAPSFALVIRIETEYAQPGARFSLALPEHLIAVADPGTVTDGAGETIADYRVDADGRTVRFAFAPGVASKKDLRARIALFANLDDVGAAGGSFTGEARSGSSVFPLSLSYGAMSWTMGNISSTWVPGPNGEGARLRVRGAVAGHAANAAEGGQWIGARGADSWPGTLRPVPGTTRLFAFDELPSTSGALGDPAAAVPASAYSVAAEGQTPGTVTMGVTVPAPRDGFYVIEQLFSLDSPGPSLFEAPGETLPKGARLIYATGSQVDTSSVLAHAQSGGASNGSSSLAYFVSSGADGSAAAAKPSLGAVRTVATESSPSRAVARVDLAVTNSGNTPLHATAVERVTADRAAVSIDAATADRGTVRVVGGAVEWSGDLEPGQRARIAYTVTAKHAGGSAGEITISGTTEGETPSGQEADAEVADDTVTVPSAPTDGTGTDPTRTPPATGAGADPTELAATGSEPLDAAPWVIALLFAGAACGTLGFSRAARGSRPGSAA